MKKKIYQPPRMEVMSVMAQQIICGSIRTEKLTESDLDWEGTDPDPSSVSSSSSSIESLTESDFTAW